MDRDELARLIDEVLTDFRWGIPDPTKPDSLNYLAEQVGYTPPYVDDEGEVQPARCTSPDPVVALVAAVVAGRRETTVPSWAIELLTEACLKIVRYHARGFDESERDSPEPGAFKFERTQGQMFKRRLTSYLRADACKRVELVLRGEHPEFSKHVLGGREPDPKNRVTRVCKQVEDALREERGLNVTEMRDGIVYHWWREQQRAE